MATVTTTEIQQIYIGYLGRAADKAGLDYWVEQITSDALTLEQLRANITNEQQEYIDGYGQLSRADLVDQVYQTLFERAPDDAGKEYWVNGDGKDVNADQLIKAFLDGASPADQTILDNKTDVAEYYTAAAGANYDKTAATGTIADVTADAATVAAAKQTVDTTLKTDITFTLTSDVTSVTEGNAVTFTVTATDSLSTDTVLNYQIGGVAVAGGTADPASDLGKVTGEVTIPAGQSTATFTVTPSDDGATEGFEGFNITLLDSNFASVATSDNVVIKDGASAGQTFTLTAAADAGADMNGTTGDDTYVAAVGTDGLAANGTTLNPGDVLNGGAGDDVLSVSISGTNTGNTTTSAVTLSGIETIAVSNFETSGDLNTIDLAQATDVATISQIASSANGDTAFTTVRDLVAVEMSNGAGDLSVTYTDAAVEGTADAQTLTLSAQTAGEFTVAGSTTGGVETLNIVSNTSDNTIAINDAATATIETMNISGAADLTLTEGTTNANDAVTTIDASAFTGDLAVTTGSAAQDLTVTGGTGDDEITLSGDTFSADDTIDGGAGDDKLTITTAITGAAQLAGVSNIETLASDENITLAENVSVTKFDVTAAGADVVTLNTGYTNDTTVVAGAGDTVTNSANVTLTVEAAAADLQAADTTTITGGTGTDSLNVTADTDAAAGGFAGVDFSNITNVDQVTVTDGGDDAASGTKPAGDDVTLNLGTYATALTIDASALDAGTVTNGTMGADDEVLTVAGGNATAALTVTGGAGRDDITVGSGNDTVDGGAGDDSIDASAGGNDTLSGGAGDDTFTLGDALTADDTIDGGDGDDKLVVTSLNSAALANVTNVETLAFNGTATLTDNLSFTAVDLTEGANADSLTFGAGYTNATTVDVDAGDDVINTANVELTVNAAAGDLESADNTVITGGTDTADNTQTNTLNITADGSAGVDFASRITNIDAITVVDGGDDAATGTNPAGDDIVLNLGAYATDLTIDASALDAGTLDANGAMQADDEVLTVNGASASSDLTVTGGAGYDVITVGSGDDTVNGGEGNDTITAGAGGNDNISAGAGDDTIDMATALTFDDTVDGGDGDDTLKVDVSGGTFGNAGELAKVSNIETLAFENAGSINAGSSFAGFNNFDLTHASDQALTLAGGFTGDTTVTLTGDDTNADTITNTANVALTVVANADDIDAATTIAGGTGTDTITLTANNGAADLTLVSGVDTINVMANTATNSADNDATITVHDATIASDGTLVINAADLTDSNATLTVNMNNAADTGALNVTGGAGADVINTGASNDTVATGVGNDQIISGAGNDTIDAGAGDDFVNGGAGLDTITVGAGADVVQMNTNSNLLSFATVTDFAAGDALSLVGAGTDTFTSAKVELSASATLSDYINAAAASTSANTNGVVSWFNFGSNTYVVSDNGASGTFDASTDMVIELQGEYDLSTATFTAGAGTDNSRLTFADDASLTATPLADTLVGTANADSITGGAGADSIDGGAGADTYNYSAAADSTLNNAAAPAAGTDTVTVTNGDIVSYGTDIAAVIAATVAEGTAVDANGDDLITSLSTAFAANDDDTANIEAGIISYTGGERYLVIDIDSSETIDENDVIIELSGVATGLTLTNGDAVISV